MKRKNTKKRVLIIIFVTVFIIIALCACAFLLLNYTHIGYRMTAEWHGFVDMGDNILFNENFSGDYDEIYDIVNEALVRVKDFFGELRSDPTIIICDDESKFERLGGSHDTMTLAVFDVYSYISLAYEWVNVDVMAHEITHAETHERLYNGRILISPAVPVWFDEGVALQNDYRAHYSRSAWKRHTEGGTIAPSFHDIADAEAFYDADPDTVRYNYIVSKFELIRWLDESGGNKALVELIDKINSGEDFYDLYDVPVYEETAHD